MDLDEAYRQFQRQLDIFKFRHKAEYRQAITKILQELFKRNGLVYSKKSIKRIFQSGKINKLQVTVKRQTFIDEAVLGWVDLPDIDGLIEFLYENAAASEIFRRPGNRRRIEELETQIDSGELIIWSTVQIFDAADLLKRYIRSLRYPLINRVSQKCHKYLANNRHLIQSKDLLSILQVLFICLPSKSQQLLNDLLFMLQKAATEQTNPQSTQTLATIFLPCLLPSLPSHDPLFSGYCAHLEFIIDNWEEISQTNKLKCHCTCDCKDIADHIQTALFFPQPANRFRFDNILHRYRKWRHRENGNDVTPDHDVVYDSDSTRSDSENYNESFTLDSRASISLSIVKSARQRANAYGQRDFERKSIGLEESGYRRNIGYQFHRNRAKPTKRSLKGKLLGFTETDTA